TIQFAASTANRSRATQERFAGREGRVPRRDLRDNFLRPQVGSLALEADETRAERCYIDNDHDESEEIHPHHEPDSGVHRTDADQPNLSCFVAPNKKRISDFQETNESPCNWEQVLPSHEHLRINDVKRGPDQRAPHIRTVPPPAAQTFGKSTEKIDHTQVKL